MSKRRRIAGLVLLIGALFIGARLFQSSSSLASVTIAYQLPPGTQALEARIARAAGGAPVAEFQTKLVGDEVRQKTRLTPGAYDVNVTLTVAGAARTEKRRIDVTGDGTITIDLR